MSQEVVMPRRPRRNLRKRIQKKLMVIDDGDDNKYKEESRPVVTRKKQKVSQLTSMINSFSKKVEKAKSEDKPQERLDTKNIEVNEVNDQWIDKYGPTELQMIAIHKKKLSDVREIVEDMLKPDSGTKLLILSGPSGSSKSTTVKLLASTLIHNDTPLIEWFNPSTQTVVQFQEFLGEAKYRIGKNLSIILIEELPNVFHLETQEKFQNALQDWVDNPRILPPLILVITEYDMANDENKNQQYGLDNNFTVETILGRKLLNNQSVKRVKFNPVNATLTKKTLKNIAEQENKIFQNIPKIEINEKILELSTFGDIRSAISAFQFWSQWRIIDKNLTIDMGKETVMSIFHAIGKCIYGTKSDATENESIIKVNQDYLNRSSILRLGLLENYTRYNSSKFELETACKLTDGYSLADTLNNESIALELATRTTRDSFRDIPIVSSNSEVGFNFPREWKVRRKITQCIIDVNKYIDIEMRRKQLTRTFQDSNLYYGFYEPLINKQKVFKNKSKIAYLESINSKIPFKLYQSHEPFIQERLGGPFQEILVDSDLVSETNEYSLDKYFTAYNNINVSDTDSGSEFDDDPIIETEEENDDTFGDDKSFENALLNFSQRKTLNKSASNLSQKNIEFFNDFDDDFSD